MSFRSRLRLRARQLHFRVNDLWRWRSQRIEDLLDRLPEAEGQWPSQPGLFAVCNPPYFHAHAVPLIASIMRNAAGTPLHLHLYDPTEDEVSVLSALAARTPLTWTWEHGGMDALDARRRRIYMQSVRFVRLYQAASAAARPMLALDVDSLVMRPPAKFVPESASLGLILRPDKPDPGTRVLASAVYVAPGGLAALGDAAARIAVHLAAPTHMLDQRCLWIAYEMHRESIDFWPIPPALSDFKLSPDSAIWTGKGSRKASGEFVEAQRRLATVCAVDGHRRGPLREGRNVSR